MNKNIENIAKALDAKEKERREVLSNGRQELAELDIKIKELNAKLASPNNLDEYKDISQALRDAREYKTYLTTKINTAEKGKLLEEAEYKEIKGAIIEEVNAIQEETAPELEQAILKAVELMAQYNNRVLEVTRILDHAGRLYSPNGFISSRDYGGEISRLNTGRANWLQKFVYMFYSYADEADRINNNDTHNVWSKK